MKYSGPITFIALVIMLLCSCGQNVAVHDVHCVVADSVCDTFEYFVYDSAGECSSVYAYTPCDGVEDVTSSKEVPLHLYYSTNSKAALQGDLLIALQTVPYQDSIATLNFKHALSKLSFVWQQQDVKNPDTTFKLHQLLVRAKQSGTLDINPVDKEPVWKLDVAKGDFQFRVYVCPDDEVPDDEQRFFNPSDDLLRNAHSLLLVPGVAVSAYLKYSVWKKGQFVKYITAPSLILGGREHMAAYLLYDKHYTYTFHPSARDIDPVDVTLETYVWSTGQPE